MHVRNHFFTKWLQQLCTLYSLAKMLKLPRNKNNINCEYYDPTISKFYKWIKINPIDECMYNFCGL